MRAARKVLRGQRSGDGRGGKTGRSVVERFFRFAALSTQSASIIRDVSQGTRVLSVGQRVVPEAGSIIAVFIGSVGSDVEEHLSVSIKVSISNSSHPATVMQLERSGSPCTPFPSFSSFTNSGILLQTALI